MTTEAATTVPMPMTATYRNCRRAARRLFALWFRWRVLHRDRVPMTGPVIVAANHVSFLDPPLIGSAVDRTVSSLARDTLFHTPGFGWLIRQLNAVPVDREGGGAGLKAVLDLLQAGGCVVLFPEGTRSRDGRPQRAKSGIGLAAIRSTAPVVPVRIFGAFEAYGRHRILPWPGQVILKFGHPLRFDRLRAEARTCDKARLKAIYQEVADQVMAAIAELDPAEEVARFP